VWGWRGGKSAVEEGVSWGREKESEGRGLYSLVCDDGFAVAALD